jgi:hypothetical protein
MMVLVWLCRQGRMFRITLGHSEGRGQLSSYPLVLTLILMAFFPAKFQELVAQKTISYFYIVQQFLGFDCRFKISEQLNF